MYITFTEGYYNIKGQPTNVAGMTFKLVEDFKVSKGGEGYVTVEGGSQPGFPDRSIRIRCEQGAYNTAGSAKPIPQGVSMLTALKSKTVKGAEVTDFTQIKISDEAVAHETDEEIIERTRMRFEILKDMTKAVKSGDVRAMIVTGPPGVGKSFGVEEVLAKDDLFKTQSFWTTLRLTSLRPLWIRLRSVLSRGTLTAVCSVAKASQTSLSSKVVLSLSRT